MTIQQAFSALITKIENNFLWLKNNKQNTLVSGTNIKTINNTSLLGSGNIEIQGGGTVTVDDELSTTSENPVQNKVINSALGNKLDKSGGTMTGNLSVNNTASITTNGYVTGTWLQTTSASINNNLTTVAMLDNNGWIYKQSKDTLLSGKVDKTSIVSTVSASSTNEQVVGAKLFYDTCGDIETALNTINSGSNS